MASLATPNGKEMIRRQPSKARVMNPNIPEKSKWSPVSDAIVRISPVAKANGEVSKMKIDEYMNTILYGKEKSPLPVFEKLCRENH